MFRSTFLGRDRESESIVLLRGDAACASSLSEKVMDRTTIGITTFFSIVGLAMGTMIVTGRSQHPRAAAAPSVTEPSRDAAAPRRSSGSRSDTRDLEGQVNAMMNKPSGYGAQAARNTMRMKLRELMMAEEIFYQDSNHYTTDLSKLMVARITGDVIVLRITSANNVGWSAETTHPAMPGKSCVLFSGPVAALPSAPQTLAEHITPLGERDLVCDKP